ncbi:hypothetical protein B0T14DRAFT_563678 [Immersiella caudata]|uniref:F-box domain-containing protein n=1 Tax=Immersiella caudata TaxID=314043 RepID=A0AA39X6K4_9PEZI|nr:hypothetical protein B0T14DRAFT_563678 [Immersiella caudata]
MDPAAVFCPLIRLPGELQKAIIAEVELWDRLPLRNTCRYFRSIIPPLSKRQLALAEAYKRFNELRLALEVARKEGVFCSRDYFMALKMRERLAKLARSCPEVGNLSTCAPWTSAPAPTSSSGFQERSRMPPLLNLNPGISLRFEEPLGIFEASSHPLDIRQLVLAERNEAATDLYTY